MPKDTQEFGGRPGRYHCELIIGDIRIKNPFRWHLIDVFIDIPKVSRIVEYSIEILQIINLIVSE